MHLVKINYSTAILIIEIFNLFLHMEETTYFNMKINNIEHCNCAMITAMFGT